MIRSVHAALDYINPGTQDVVVPGVTETPKAVWVFGTSRGPTFGTSDHARGLLGIGAQGETTYGASVTSANAVGTSNAKRHGQQGELLYVLNSLGNFYGSKANINSWIPGGVRLNVTNIDSIGGGLFLFFFGDDVQAKTGTFSHPAATLADTTVSGVGFEPNLIFTISAYGSAGYDISHFSNSIISYGITHNVNGVLKNVGIGYSDDGGVSVMKIDSVISETYSMMAPWDNGSFLQQGYISSVNSDGFVASWDIQEAATDRYFAYLALKVPDRIALGLGQHPTSTGLKEYTYPGFAPKNVLMGTTSNNVLDDVTYGSSMGACIINPSGVNARGIMADDGNASAVTRNWSHEACSTGDGNQTNYASFAPTSELTDLGWNLDYSIWRVQSYFLYMATDDTIPTATFYYKHNAVEDVAVSGWYHPPVYKKIREASSIGVTSVETPSGDYFTVNMEPVVDWSASGKTRFLLSAGKKNGDVLSNDGETIDLEVSVYDDGVLLDTYNYGNIQGSGALIVQRLDSVARGKASDGKNINFKVVANTPAADAANPRSAVVRYLTLEDTSPRFEGGACVHALFSNNISRTGACMNIPGPNGIHRLVTESVVNSGIYLSTRLYQSDYYCRSVSVEYE